MPLQPAAMEIKDSISYSKYSWRKIKKTKNKISKRRLKKAS